MTPRRIAVLTGTRAEYGLLRPLVQELMRRPGLEAGLLVTGTHLAREFGHTVDEIEADGLPIWERIECLMAGDTPAAVCRSMALACVGVSDALARHRPDLLVLLGDRYELFAAAQAAMIHRVPIAHLHGGEGTEGLIDEAIRHAVTKLAHLHFVAAPPFRDRVVQLGEDPARVFTVGALGVDNAVSLPRLGQAALEADLGIPLAGPVFVVTYHPLTLAEGSGVESVHALTAALGHFAEASVVATFPNSDTFGRALVAPLQDFVDSRRGRAILVQSLGAKRYMSLLALSGAVVVGNSSSGLIEAPSFGIPTVNIGPRQRGRVRAESVIDCEADAQAIRRAIEKALSPAFRAVARGATNPYGDGRAARRIADVIETARLDGILMKVFHDRMAS